MLCKRPLTRYSLEEVRRHPWITNIRAKPTYFSIVNDSDNDIDNESIPDNANDYYDDMNPDSKYNKSLFMLQDKSFLTKLTNLSTTTGVRLKKKKVIEGLGINLKLKPLNNMRRATHVGQSMPKYFAKLNAHLNIQSIHEEKTEGVETPKHYHTKLTEEDNFDLEEKSSVCTSDEASSDHKQLHRRFRFKKKSKTRRKIKAHPSKSF
jgi:hypothetical protein